MILYVTFKIGTVRRSNRVRVESKDPTMVGAEICISLAETFNCDPRDVMVENVTADPVDSSVPVVR